MTPTAEHLTLLHQLPEDVHAMLKAHGPGWLFNGEDWDPVRADPGLATVFADLWLPCDPTAIGQVAIDLMGGHHTVELETTDDGTTCARMRSTLTDTWTHWRISKDAHTVVLRLLICVCAGGEE